MSVEDGMLQAEDGAKGARAVVPSGYLLQGLALLITALTLIPPYIGLLSPNLQKQKMLQSNVEFATNISDQLGNIPSGTLKMKLTFDGVDIKNLYSLIVGLSNTGDVPILPRDYASNLSVNVNPPWKIIGIFNAPTAPLQPNWKKISDQKYEALPQLFNVGDQLIATLYLTNPLFDIDKNIAVYSIGFNWGAHIAGVPKIEPTAPSPPKYSNITWFPVFVLLGGWKLILTILMSLIFFITYLVLYYAEWPETRSRVPEIFLIVASGFLSFGASEALATFVVPLNLPPFNDHPYSFAYNTPWIVLNACALAFLFWRVQKKRVVYQTRKIQDLEAD